MLPGYRLGLREHLGTWSESADCRGAAICCPEYACRMAHTAANAAQQVLSSRPPQRPGAAYVASTSYLQFPSSTSSQHTLLSAHALHAPCSEAMPPLPREYRWATRAQHSKPRLTCPPPTLPAHPPPTRAQHVQVLQPLVGAAGVPMHQQPLVQQQRVDGRREGLPPQPAAHAQQRFRGIPRLQQACRRDNWQSGLCTAS